MSPSPGATRWVETVARAAELLSSDLSASTILCVGQSLEPVVAALQGRGLQAQLLKSGAALDRRFDLVLCFVPFDQLPPDRVDLLTRISSCLLCGIAPEDIDRLTEPSLQLAENFVAELAKRGFFRDVTCDLSHLEHPAICFRKHEGSASSAIVAYDRKLLQLKRESAGIRRVAIEYREASERLEREIDRLHQRLTLQAQRSILESPNLAMPAGGVVDVNCVALVAALQTIEDRLAPPNSQRVRAYRWILRECHSAAELILRSFDVRDRLLARGRTLLNSKDAA